MQTHKLIVKITFRDDNSEIFECADHPYMGSPWIILYMENFKRIYMPVEAIGRVETYLETN